VFCLFSPLSRDADRKQVFTNIYRRTAKIALQSRVWSGRRVVNPNLL
jgi:hypothetical protein